MVWSRSFVSSNVRVTYEGPSTIIVSQNLDNSLPGGEGKINIAVRGSREQVAPLYYVPGPLYNRWGVAGDTHARTTAIECSILTTKDA